MPTRYKLLVTADDVGVLIEAGQEDATREIAAAREVLRAVSSSPTRPSPSSAPQTGKTLPDRILALSPDYFAEPRESLDICKQLARAAQHYKPVRVRVELSRLVARGMLRRIGDGTKGNPYKYVNP